MGSIMNPTGTVVSTRNEDLFVDYLGLVVDGRGGNVVEKLRRNLQKTLEISSCH